MKKALVLAGCMLFIHSVQAQFAYNYLKAADEYFQKGDYYSAAQYYERALTQRPSKTDKVDPYKIEPLTQEKKAAVTGSRAEILYKTAESFRLINNYPKAEPYYGEAAEIASQTFPLARYWYGKSLRFNSKFAEAEAALTRFLQENTTGGDEAEDAKREIANLQFIQQELRKDTTMFALQKISADAFTSGADYAPTLMNNGTIVFTSTRADDKASNKKTHLNRLFQGAAGNSVTFAATKVEIPQATDMHQGVAAFAPDGNTMYLTRWTGLDGKNTASLYVSTKAGDAWSEPTPLKGDVNVDGFSSQEPFVSPDGQYLYYSSNKPGGLGKFDLYVIPVAGTGNGGVSSNLGEAINSAGDDRAPYYHAPSRSIVFASNGRVGMGGMDFFQSKGTVGSWSNPVNLGYPVNSVKDDIYLVSTANKYLLDNIYFSSDRSSPCCLEMYSLAKARPKRLISGMVVDCKTNMPISGATVVVMDTISNQQVANLTTSTTGRYELTLDDYQPLRVTASAQGYEGQRSLHFNTPANEEVNTLDNPTICLNMPEVPIVVNKPVLMDSIYFEFDKHRLLPSSYPRLDELVALLRQYPTAAVEIGAHTDALGDDNYNMRLSELRAKSVVDYLISKGIEAGRLQPKGYGESMPIAPNRTEDGRDNPQGRAKNRRVELKVLHY